MKIKTAYILLFFMLHFPLCSQNLCLKGKMMPGNIIIGQVEKAQSVFLDNKNITFDNEGNFVLGFDRDDNGARFLKIKYTSGKAYVKKLLLSERHYEVQEINNMKQELVSPPDNEISRINKEREIIDSIESKIGLDNSAYYVNGFTRPVTGGRISGVFGSQRVLNGIAKSPHNGLDIAKPEGAEVVSTSDGIVVMTGNNYYYRGNFVIIDHGQGLFSRYFHLSMITISEGDTIKKGDKIGEVGTTGRSTGPHLHWGVQWFDKRIDPSCLLNLLGEK